MSEYQAGSRPMIQSNAKKVVVSAHSTSPPALAGVERRSPRHTESRAARVSQITAYRAKRAWKNGRFR